MLNIFQILIGKMREYGNVNLILSEALSVLPKTELLKPVRNLLASRLPAGVICKAVIREAPA